MTWDHPAHLPCAPRRKATWRRSVHHPFPPSLLATNPVGLTRTLRAQPKGFPVPIRTSYLGLRRQLESPVSTPCLNHLSCKDMIRFTMKWIPWGRPWVPGVEPQPLDIQCPTALTVSLFHLGWVWRDGYGSCRECLPLLFLWMQQCEASGGQFCHLREAVCKLADVGRKPGKDCNCLLPFPRCCRERMQSPSRDCSTSRIPACVSAGCFYPRGLATFPWKQRRP